MTAPLSLLVSTILLLSAPQDREEGKLPYRPGFGLHSEPVELQGLKPHVKFLGTAGLDMDVSDLDGSGEDVLSRPTSVTLEYDEKKFEAVGVGLEVDLGMIYAVADVFFGTWDGEATLTYSTEGIGTTVRRSDLEGDIFGAGLGLGWPGVTYKGGGTELAAGPEIGVRYHREELDDVEGEPYDLTDTLNEVTPYVALRLAASFALGEIRLTIDGKAEYIFGDLQGPAGELAVGLYWSF